MYINEYMNFRRILFHFFFFLSVKFSGSHHPTYTFLLEMIGNGLHEMLVPISNILKAIKKKINVNDMREKLSDSLAEKERDSSAESLHRDSLDMSPSLSRMMK